MSYKLTLAIIYFMTKPFMSALYTRKHLNHLRKVNRVGPQCHTANLLVIGRNIDWIERDKPIPFFGFPQSVHGNKIDVSLTRANHSRSSGSHGKIDAILCLYGHMLEARRLVYYRSHNRTIDTDVIFIPNLCRKRLSQ